MYKSQGPKFDCFHITISLADKELDLAGVVEKLHAYSATATYAFNPPLFRDERCV